MAWLGTLPAIVRLLLWVLIILIAIIILALIIHALAPGGVDWHLNIGYFHWDIGVT